jgi:MEMO1 family protein
MTIRKSDLAGSWYPATAAECEKSIIEFQKQIDVRNTSTKMPIGGIVPHAGWYFSGHIACNVFRFLKEGPLPEVIIVFGLHLHASSPACIMQSGAWETPFGPVVIAEDFATRLMEKYNFGGVGARSFANDNTIEVQLPFLKYYFGDAKFVPIGVPPNADAIKIGTAVAETASELKTSLRVIGSTDLTHYGDNYGFAPAGRGAAAVDWVVNQSDPKVIAAMQAMQPEQVLTEAASSHNACCAGAVAAALCAGKALGADKAHPLAYATSHDKNPGESFVGYVGLVF